jgi:hypothetical protein
MRVSEAATAVFEVTPSGRKTCEWRVSMVQGPTSFLITKNSKR